MFNKFITFMMVLSIFTVNAGASTNSGLKTAFDELNYSLSVDWDQKDQSFYTAKMGEFTKVMNDLQAQGLTNAQIVEFVKSEVKNEGVARDLETAFNIVSINKMSTAEASQYMIATMKKSYSTGASWNGLATYYAVIGVLLVAAIIAIASAPAPTTTGTGTDTGLSCSQQYTCQYTCFYDFYNNYTCSNVCLWMTVCY